MVKLNDLLGISLLLIAIALFVKSFSELNLFVKAFQLIGSGILIIVESVFLWKMVRRR